jgi:hypothetical protein
LSVDPSLRDADELVLGQAQTGISELCEIAILQPVDAQMAFVINGFMVPASLAKPFVQLVNLVDAFHRLILVRPA